jgi:F-type H+-transporting ATPase subunit delta
MTGSISRNYARALFELASEEGVRDDVELDLHASREALFDDREVRAFLASRLAGRAAKKRLVAAGLEGVVHAHCLTMLSLLVDRGRTLLLGEIAEEYQRLCRLARGVRKVTVSSAFPLEEEEEKRITASLSERFAATIELNTEVRPSLIGGVVAESEGNEIELSVEGALKRLKTGLSQR